MSSVIPVHSPLLSQIPWVRHGFFTREGGVSKGAFEGLNAGLGSGDVPSHIIENRARISAYLNGQLITLKQVHSPDAHFVQSAWRDDAPDRPEGDALVTETTGIAIGALTADCVPVLFADNQKKLVAAAHAGWGGTYKGVLENTVKLLLEQGATLSTLVASIGPAIAQKSYEVGPELREKFMEADAANAAFFVANAGKNSYQFSLPHLVAQRLRACGITMIDHLDEDTYSQPQRFFSFRRSTHEQVKEYGRQVSAICIQS